MFARKTPEVTQSLKFPGLHTIRDDDLVLVRVIYNDPFESY